MAALNFNQHDLEVNRTGQLTPQQQARLQSQRNNARYGLIGTASVASGVVAGVASALSRSKKRTLLTVWAGSAALLSWVALRRFMPPANPVVKQIEGTAHRHMEHYGEDYHLYFVLVDHMAFGISQAAYQALEEGVPYRAYYVEQEVPLLMSLEEVE